MDGAESAIQASVYYRVIDIPVLSALGFQLIQLAFQFFGFLCIQVVLLAEP